MPTLNWLGKDKIINYDKKVSFKVLNKIYCYGEKSDNMIIHGDNLEGLKSLLLDHKIRYNVFILILLIIQGS